MTITQRAANRSGIIRTDFLYQYDWNASWENMTDNGKIMLPRNLFYQDEANQLNPLNGSRVNIGGFISGATPILMRGDRVQVEAGYMYDMPDRTVAEKAVIIDGYISRVYSKSPIEFDVEDNMWLLKQTDMATKAFTSSSTIEDVLIEIVNRANSIHGTTLTANALTTTNIANTLIVGNETAAQLLNRIKNIYGFHAYFRGNELRCGILNYFVAEDSRAIFIMNGQGGNVPADGQDLEYQRKEDLVLSCIARSTQIVANGTAKDGAAKTKKQRLEVLVTLRNGSDTPTYTEIAQGDRAPENTEGERYTYHFSEASTMEELKELAIAKLRTFYYDGLKGSFESFGIPYVRHVDSVEIRNPEFPEQSGIYKVKAVNYRGGVGGLRQRIYLHYKITT